MRTRSLSSTGSSSSEVSTSISIEAPKGCLRFFLSHSSSTRTPVDRPMRSISKTPKSAPAVPEAKPSLKSNPRVLKENQSKRSVSDKHILQKPLRCKKNSPRIQHWRPVNKPSSRIAPRPKGNPVLSRLPSGSGESKQGEQNFVVKIDDKDELLTPLAKLSAASCSDYEVVSNNIQVDQRSKPSSCDTRTPPLEASISPEIQCSTSTVTKSVKTPTCYGAGYIVSGVSDKRKCRPRGILTVVDNGDLGFGQPRALDDFGDNDEPENDINDTVSVMPVPVDASMQWLLSPCNEDKDEEEENSEDGSCQLQQNQGCESCDGFQSPSELLDHLFSPDICISSSGKSLIMNNSGNKLKPKSGSLLSPCEYVELRGLAGHAHDNDDLVSFSHYGTAMCENVLTDKSKEETISPYKLGVENSPASMDTLGSENVIQTPQSDSCSDIHADFSCFKAEDLKMFHFDSEISSTITTLKKTSLSPKRHMPISDPTRSTFCFDSFPMPSDSIDLSDFQKAGSIRDSHLSSLSQGSISKSQLSISWRDESENQIFEVEDFDHCRCLSDEEDNLNSLSDGLLLKSSQKQNIDANAGIDCNTAFQSTEFVHENWAFKGQDRAMFPRTVACSFAESLSCEGGSLIHSDDSDWAACYKNQFFQE